MTERLNNNNSNKEAVTGRKKILSYTRVNPCLNINNGISVVEMNFQEQDGTACSQDAMAANQNLVSLVPW